jgi:integration host factor subunit alpha
MTKMDIIKNVYDRLALSKHESADIVDKFFEVIKETLAEEKNVKITGFGNFSVKHKRSRRGRNPHTGEEMEIKERKVLLFWVSKVLRDKMNG